MRRRTVLAAVGSALTAGCLSTPDPQPTAEIQAVELENHRRDESAAFALRIDRGGETVFERTSSLDPAGSGDSTAVFERPVGDSGASEVRVELAGETASPEPAELTAEGRSCLYLRFYGEPSGLTWDHTAYDRCDTNS
jgi:hypothetical protein